MTNRNVVLIDYENVHPEKFEPVGSFKVEVKMFVGHKQTGVNKELAASLQKLGYDADYVLATGGGRNSLDFHIACHVGELIAADPKVSIRIISHDMGFDPLIRHLRQRDIDAHRHDTVFDLPFVEAPYAGSMDDLMEKVQSNLKKRGAHRPRMVKTLKAALENQFCATSGGPQTRRTRKGTAKAQANQNQWQGRHIPTSYHEGVKALLYVSNRSS